MENPNVPTAEELEAEKQALVVPNVDEVKEKIVTEYGFDPEADAEKIEKLANREIEQAKKISSAIGAKIKHREARTAAEGKIPKVEVKSESELSSKDVIYLSKVDIHEEDVDEVINYAKKMGVGVKEAHAFYKPILTQRTEERKTAEVTNTGTARRSAIAPTADELVAKARKGEFPEDDASIEKMMKAKMGGKK